MNLEKFCFPVVERAVAVDNDQHSLIDLQETGTFLPNDYKAIVREDTNQVISIVKQSYKLVPNATLIDKLLRELAMCGHTFRFNRQHSYVDNNRMRLQMTFPELTLQDSESDIALSAYLHNSYDQSEGVRFIFGSIRYICSNGCVFGEVLSRYYSRHTKGFSFENLGEKLSQATEYFPEIQERIYRLERLPVDEALVEKVSEKISKRLAEQVIEEHEIGRISQWKLYNRLTNYASHELDPAYASRYQHNISNVFNL
ncbi:DUF932 domain-containing protein [Rhodohalobacter sp. 8-1]|uniref:DUF932 domain-containing protein n=1 Tax=Rhodohalobacter sp. 8-1 TaxID=3131972 RepID=UPI0030ED474D